MLDPEIEHDASMGSCHHGLLPCHPLPVLPPMWGPRRAGIPDVSGPLSARTWALAFRRTCSCLLFPIAQPPVPTARQLIPLAKDVASLSCTCPQGGLCQPTAPGHVLQGDKCHHPATRDGSGASQGGSIHFPSAGGLRAEECGLKMKQGGQVRRGTVACLLGCAHTEGEQERRAAPGPVPGPRSLLTASKPGRASQPKWWGDSV